jgi:polysaccharide biosynthesis/export protein
MMRQIIFVSFVFCVFSVCGMSQTPAKKNLVAGEGQPKDARLPDAQAEASPEFTIGPEDVLSITVWHEPDLTNRVTVRPDGKIGIPLLNDIQAGGLTPKQLQQDITEGLRKFVSGPQVSVIVQEIHSQIVYITGSIARPGAYPLGHPMTVMEFLVQAGGLSEFAKAEDIQVLRKESGKLRRFRFNYKQFAEGRNYQQDIFLRTGDMIIVP